MKTLIIFLAETRFSDLTYNNFVENVLKPDDDVCVCIAVDDNYEYDDKYYKMAKYKFIIKDQLDYGPLFEDAYNEIISENKDKLEKPNIHWREFVKLGNTLFGGVVSNDKNFKTSGSAGILIYFRYSKQNYIILKRIFGKFVWEK